MGKSRGFAVFDQKERARVRRALLRYMAENVMGAPTLHGKILDADQPRKRYMSLSTLQRFLAGARDTQDHHVALCHQFASQLPYYEEGRDIERFGEALFDFLQGQVEVSERKALIERVSALAGSYKSGRVHLTLDQPDGQPYLFAEEIKPLPRHDKEMAGRRRVHEGVLVLTSSSVNMFLRNTLTRQPKLAACGCLRILKIRTGRPCMGRVLSRALCRLRPLCRIRFSSSGLQIRRTSDGW